MPDPQDGHYGKMAHYCRGRGGHELTDAWHVPFATQNFSFLLTDPIMLIFVVAINVICFQQEITICIFCSCYFVMFFHHNFVGLALSGATTVRIQGHFQPPHINVLEHLVEQNNTIDALLIQ